MILEQTSVVIVPLALHLKPVIFCAMRTSGPRTVGVFWVIPSAFPMVGRHTGSHLNAFGGTAPQAFQKDALRLLEFAVYIVEAQFRLRGFCQAAAGTAPAASNCCA